MIINKYNKNARVVNLRYTVYGLRFDAAIDCNWILHAYGEYPGDMNKRIPIELYCFDHKDWDIKVIFQEYQNDQPSSGLLIAYSICNFDGILEETKKWIEENSNNKKDEKEILPLF